MKHLRKFNESGESFDLEFAMTKIKEHFTEEEVVEKFDEEVLEWVDPDWEEDYDSEYDWYIDHNNGEAQDVVIGQVIDWYNANYTPATDDDRMNLYDEIKSEYNL